MKVISTYVSDKMIFFLQDRRQLLYICSKLLEQQKKKKGLWAPHSQCGWLDTIDNFLLFALQHAVYNWTIFPLILYL